MKDTKKLGKKTKIVQTNHLNYIAEDCPIDYGYWLYILLDNNLLQADESIAKMEFKRYLDFF